MEKFDKISIYFDTNMLERRHSNSALFLSELSINPEYYEIENMIRDLSLSKKVEICIPEIVWMEIKKHLKEFYRSEKDSMIAKMAQYRMSFGSIADITCEFNDITNDSQYEEYLEQITQDFLENPKVSAKIIPYPKDQDTICEIIDKAMYTVAPFVKVNKGKKEYTDAGFKDALIYETLLKNTNDHLCILVSNDSDFDNLFCINCSTNLKLCKTAKDVKETLISNFDIDNKDVLITEIKNDKYFISNALTTFGYDKDIDYSIKEIRVVNISEDKEAKFELDLVVDGIDEIFTVLYNITAKEIVDITKEESEVS